jgi:ABC-type glycerol-3-phosphate transport system substrate-binding protein
MMFYRTDIFEELGLTPPKTWQEFEETVAQLQTKNMQVGISDLFTTHLMQKGINVYNEDLSQTNFDKPEAVEAFEHSMQYFTHTGLPDVFDFYNRFRSGEMPMGIQDISQYNMLSAAAPEIKGLWEMVPIPGTETEDGSVICTEPGSASSAAVLFKKAKDNPGAWEFIRWWAGAEAQSRYGNDLEMILGTAARYMTANKQAIRALPWSNKELGNIFAQWDQVKGIPTIPASFTRARASSFVQVSGFRGSIKSVRSEPSSSITIQRTSMFPVTGRISIFFTVPAIDE